MWQAVKFCFFLSMSTCLAGWLILVVGVMPFSLLGFFAADGFMPGSILGTICIMLCLLWPFSKLSLYFFRKALAIAENK